MGMWRIAGNKKKLHKSFMLSQSDISWLHFVKHFTLKYCNVTGNLSVISLLQLKVCVLSAATQHNNSSGPLLINSDPLDTDPKANSVCKVLHALDAKEK